MNRHPASLWYALMGSISTVFHSRSADENVSLGLFKEDFACPGSLIPAPSIFIRSLCSGGWVWIFAMAVTDRILHWHDKCMRGDINLGPTERRIEQNCKTWGNVKFSRFAVLPLEVQRIYWSWHFLWPVILVQFCTRVSNALLYDKSATTNLLR